MRTPTPVMILLAASAWLVAGCEEPNSLSGSISTSHDLSFDSVELRLFTDTRAYELDYIKEIEGADVGDLVAKIIFDEPEGGVKTGDEIDLAEVNGVVSRVTSKNDPFPDMDTGTFLFNEGGVEAGPATGEFHVLFKSGGRTLEGRFDTKLKEASFE